MPEKETGFKTKDKWAVWADEKLGDNPTKNFKLGKIEWCYAFYRGEQYKIWDERKGIVRDVNIPREARSVYNICKLFADIFVSKMLKNDPIPTVRPFSTNTEEFDENLSLAFGAVSEYWWKAIADGSKQLTDTVRWGAIGGIGVSKVYWDKNMKSGIYTGDVKWESINPRHVFFNPDARTEDELRWVIHRFPKEKSVVEEQFNLEKDSLTADDKELSEGDRTFSTKSQDGYSTADDKDTVLVHDIWIKKCREHKKGKHVIVAGGKTLVEEDNTEPDVLPFFVYNVNELLDDIYGLGIIFPILTIQRDMNRLNSLIMENSSRMGSVKWLVPEQGNFLPQSFTDEGGEKIPYTAPYKPEQTQAASMPQHIVARWGELFRIAQTITKLQDVGMGMIPYRGSQTSPGVISQLKDSEDVLFAVEVATVSNFVRRIMKRFRMLTKKYYAEERIVQVMGENKYMEAQTYLAGADNNDYDYDFGAGGGFAKSDDAIVSQIMKLGEGQPQNTLLDKFGVDWRTVGDIVMRKVGLIKLHEDTYKDTRQAKWNLQDVLNGVRPIISKYINPDAHIKVFTDYTKTEQYRTIDNGIKFAIDYYIDQCNAIKMGMMQPQMPPQGMPQPGLQMPIGQTPEEQAEASLNRSQGTGQPMPQDMGQAEGMAPQGV